MPIRARSFIVVLALIGLAITAVPGADAAPPSQPPKAEEVILFASDGMRPDLMEQYATEGLMPTYADLMAEGVVGENCGARPCCSLKYVK